MTDLAVSAGAGSLAHGVHYTVLGIGLLGLVVLLAPGRRSAPDPEDEHAVRVQALREAVMAGTLGSTRTAAPPLPRPPRILRHTSRLWLPLAVVSCTAAAGVHAAVGPAHFREKTILGVFFAVTTIVQMAWAVLVVVRPSQQVLRLGMLGNAALIGLWAVTRTVGLPGILPGPEEVGPWDLACVSWELLAIVACVPAIGSRATRVADWVDWDRRARLWTYLSVIGLGLLSISGAGS